MVHLPSSGRTRAQPARPRRPAAAPDAAVAAVLALQRRAGNAAVTRLVRDSRRAIQREPKKHTFKIGEDVTVDFAAKAKELARDGTVTAAELPALQALALKKGTTGSAPEGTVGDAERMFMAGLLDPANAALLAETDVKKGSQLTFTFASATTREGRHHLPQAVDGHHEPLRPFARDPRARARDARQGREERRPRQGGGKRLPGADEVRARADRRRGHQGHFPDRLRVERRAAVRRRPRQPGERPLQGSGQEDQQGEPGRTSPTTPSSRPSSPTPASAGRRSRWSRPPRASTPAPRPPSRG